MFNRLYSLREDNDLKQGDMAKILDVNKSNISRWETNKDVIPIKKLNIYSNYFNVSFDYLAGLSNNKDTKIKLEEFNKKEIGKRIRIFRKSQDLSLKELAEQLNTTASTIYAYETGKTLILTAFAYQIATKYKVSLDWIYGKSKVKNIEL